MIALFDNLSVFEDDNLVCIEDRLEAMSNDKASPASYRSVSNVLAMEISCFCPVEKIF